MLFNSYAFFVFLGTVLIIHFSLPQRWRNVFLLVASYWFYMQWRWEFGLLLAAQTLINYCCARAVAGSSDRRRAKGFVALAALLSFGMLGYYKYFNFFNDSFRELFLKLGIDYLVPHLNILLPVGISFYTFQAFGYTMDVYRKQCEPERNLIRFALFTAFFPQLAAGPIGRAPALLPQLRREMRLEVGNLTTGIQLIIWGLFKKVVIADRLALYVDSAYAAPGNCSGATLLLASYLFAVQIYCDFSGYSDIAIGSAKLLGYDLMQNFNLPYFSRNISEFWKRWHISLTRWFRDYLYIPLGGNRVSRFRWGVNIMIVFLISGLWHGASWTFVIWGGLHGIYYFIEALLKRLFPEREEHAQSRGRNWLKILVTFHAVVFAWIFFRAASFSDALTVIGRIGGEWGRLSLGASQITAGLNLLLVALLLAVDFAALKGWAGNYFTPGRFPGWVRVIGYSMLAAGIALLGVTNNSFIYLQF